MHVRWSSRLTWVVAMSGFFWLLILFGIGMTDYMSRGWVPGRFARTLVARCLSGASDRPLRTSSPPIHSPFGARPRRLLGGATGRIQPAIHRSRNLRRFYAVE